MSDELIKPNNGLGSIISDNNKIEKKNTKTKEKKQKNTRNKKRDTRWKWSTLNKNLKQVSLSGGLRPNFRCLPHGAKTTGVGDGVCYAEFRCWCEDAFSFGLEQIKNKNKKKQMANRVSHAAIASRAPPRDLCTCDLTQTTNSLRLTSDWLASWRFMSPRLPSDSWICQTSSWPPTRLALCTVKCSEVVVHQITVGPSRLVPKCRE